MFTSWDADSAEIKSVVALYLTGSGVRAEFIVPKIRNLISSLYIYVFIVNNICGDGATENSSLFKQLANMTVTYVFKSRCQNYSPAAQKVLRLSLLDNFLVTNYRLLLIIHMMQILRCASVGRCLIG